MKKAVLCISVSTLVLLAAAPGIRPRADANSYPEHAEHSDFSIGAFLLPPEQVKKMFKPDLNHAGYVVIEIGVFPAPGKDIDLNPTDFTLSVGEKSPALRPVSGDTIAAQVVDRPEQPRVRGPLDVTTSTGIYVGHGSYPDTDPVTGRRTKRTVTGTEVGVGCWRSDTSVVPGIRLRSDGTVSTTTPATFPGPNCKCHFTRSLGEVAAGWQDGASRRRLFVFPETGAEDQERRLGIAV